MSTLNARLLDTLTRLTTQWASAGTHGAVADAAGVQIDPVDIPPVYVLGLSGPQRAGALADALRLSRPTMSKQLVRLERGGLIERTADPDDARAVIIRLSERGAEAHSRLVAQGRTMVDNAIREWDSTEATLFAAQLARFVGALQTP